MKESQASIFLWPRDEDHHRAAHGAAIRKPPSEWKRPPGRPNHMWLRAIESDLRPLNVWKKAASREHWRSIKKRMPRRETAKEGNRQ